MATAPEPLFCARCAAELQPGSGRFYHVTIEAVADPAPRWNLPALELPARAPLPQRAPGRRRAGADPGRSTGRRFRGRRVRDGARSGADGRGTREGAGRLPRGAIPQAGDKLTASYRVDTSGGTAGGITLPGAVRVSAAQVLCSSAGTTTSAVTSSSVGGCEIAAETCRYHESASRTVRATRGSRRRNRRRSRVSSMFRRTRPSSQSYQVGAVCGEPSGRSVATTAGFGLRRNSSMSGGTGAAGTAPRI